MPVVTDKEYYLDGFLQANLDFIVARHENRWDTSLIIDGDERAGKSTLGKGIAYYLAWKMGREFTADNIYFDMDKLIAHAQTHRKQVYVSDESALDAMAEDWQQEVQKKLIKMLITCGKFGHIWIFIIPKFKMLRRYIAVERSLALIRVYSPDRIKRGYFKCYAKDAKEKLYRFEKNDLMADARRVQSQFNGRFVDVTGMLIDESVYEANKDAAIESIGGEPLNKYEIKWRLRCLVLAKELRAKGLKMKELGELLHMKVPQVSFELTKFEKENQTSVK